MHPTRPTGDCATAAPLSGRSSQVRPRSTSPATTTSSGHCATPRSSRPPSKPSRSGRNSRSSHSRSTRPSTPGTDGSSTPSSSPARSRSSNPTCGCSSTGSSTRSPSVVTATSTTSSPRRCRPRSSCASWASPGRPADVPAMARRRRSARRRADRLRGGGAGARRRGPGHQRVLRALDRGSAAHPDDGLLSRLVQSEIDGEHLTQRELLGISHLMLLGGLDTVTATLDCMVANLARASRAAAAARRRSLVGARRGRGVAATREPGHGRSPHPDPTSASVASSCTRATT